VGIDFLKCCSEPYPPFSETTAKNHWWRNCNFLIVELHGSLLLACRPARSGNDPTARSFLGGGAILLKSQSNSDYPNRADGISTSTEHFAYPLGMTGHPHDHHHHDHDHSELSETELRVRALETILTEKGYVDSAALDAIIQAYETKIGPHNGARVVAKAWSDPLFKRALLDDATKAVSALGHVSRVGDHLVAVENTPQRHNMVVCTLCSCYPWEMLGLPPVWYKAAPYRSRAVKDPRGVLADFGVSLPKEIEIRVWDSTAETRFLVLPMRPDGTDGWNEEQLAQLVTRDSMIGTGFPKTPGSQP
jgi:nitrile hydratase subunit alpha